MDPLLFFFSLSDILHCLVKRNDSTLRGRRNGTKVRLESPESNMAESELKKNDRRIRSHRCFSKLTLVMSLPTVWRTFAVAMPSAETFEATSLRRLNRMPLLPDREAFSLGRERAARQPPAVERFLSKVPASLHESASL